MKNIAILCILAAALCAAAIPVDSVDLEVYSDACTAPLSGGEGFIQIGNWRFGRVDDENHFSFSSNNGRTAVILRSDGTVHGGSGSRTDWGLSAKPLTWTYSASNPMALQSLPNVQFGRSFVQFGPNQRLGTPDDSHLSISFRTPCCGKSGIHTAGGARLACLQIACRAFAAVFYAIFSCAFTDNDSLQIFGAVMARFTSAPATAAASAS